MTTPDTDPTAPEPEAAEAVPEPSVDSDARHLRIISSRFRQLSPAGRAYARTMIVGDGAGH
jgi:hypothetical protein